MSTKEEHRNPVTSTGRRGGDSGAVNLRRRRHRGPLRRRQCRARSRLFTVAAIIAAFQTLFLLSAMLLQGGERCTDAADSTAAADDDGAPSPSYEWETWNYYQILGLEDPPPAPPADDDFAPTQTPSVDVKEVRRRRKSVTPSDVKKSYRRQAQRYHPDKVQQQRKQKQAQQRREGNGTTVDDGDEEASCAAAGCGNETSSSTTSMEEANARFARIAEAYQVLTDEAERRFYDEELGRWEDQRRWEEERSRRDEEMKGRQRQRQPDGRRGRGGGGFPWERQEEEGFFSDPMTVFEQFFSGGGSGGYEDLFFGGGGGPTGGRHHGGGGGPPLSPPRHVSERTEVLRGAGYDPRIGAVDIHRVYRREEWPPGASDDGGDGGGGYFRVVAQDFLLEGGYYPGDLRYVPISDPAVVEEGYVEGRYGTGTGGRGGGGGGSRRNEHATTREGPKDRLTEDEYMTPGSEPLRSANGRYAAYLTPRCELVIVRVDDLAATGGRSQPLWGSDTFYPSGRCFLALYGPRIGIFVGDHPDDQGRGGAQGVIWVSPMGDDDYDLEETLMPGEEGGAYSSYYLSLDDDGSLAVYRKGSGGGGQPHRRHGRVGDDALRATARWLNRECRRLWRRLEGKVRQGDDGRTADEGGGRDDGDDKDGGGRRHEPGGRRGDDDRCVWGSGVAGCNTGGRRIVAAGSDVRRKLKRSWERMSRVARDLVDSLSDEEDEDVDAFDAAGRVLGIVARNLVRVGAEAGRWGGSLARRGFREGKTVTKLLGHRISETMQKWAKAKR